MTLEARTPEALVVRVEALRAAFLRAKGAVRASDLVAASRELTDAATAAGLALLDALLVDDVTLRRVRVASEAGRESTGTSTQGTEPPVELVVADEAPTELILLDIAQAPAEVSHVRPADHESRRDPIDPVLAPIQSGERVVKQPATALQLELLQKRGLRSTTFAVPEPVAPTLSVVCPAPVPVPSREVLAQKVTELEGAVADSARWISLDRSQQLSVLSQIVPWTRYLQTVGQKLVCADLGERISTVFPTLSAFSGTYRPGFVHGLALDHQPRMGSWLEDARAAAGIEPDATAEIQRVSRALKRGKQDDAVLALLDDALVACRQDDVQLRQLALALTGRDHLLQGHARFKSLRKRVAAVSGRESAAAVELMAPAVHAPPTSLLKALVVGGDRRSDVEANWLEAGVHVVEWASGSDVRREQALADAVGSGRFDTIVLLVKFLSHASYNRLMLACARAKRRPVILRAGFGLAELRRALQPAAG